MSSNAVLDSMPEIPVTPLVYKDLGRNGDVIPRESPSFPEPKKSQ